ncbi:hypothetical protein [Falsiroseomonas sp. E2-1-a20]|uniref:hypothetical protein n=1 Tax=Falsiroseomonas sp. E2-1-a20 TaxID=3239300 RepID=UPI003F313980
MSGTKLDLSRRLIALPIGDVRTESESVLGSIFAGRRTLDESTAEAVRAFAASHNCLFLFAEFTRHPPAFEKLSSDGTPVGNDDCPALKSRRRRRAAHF